MGGSGWLWIVVDGFGRLRVVMDGCGWLRLGAYFNITQYLI